MDLINLAERYGTLVRKRQKPAGCAGLLVIFFCVCFVFFFHPSPSAPRHRSPRVGAGRTAACRAPGGGHPIRAGGRGGSGEVQGRGRRAGGLEALGTSSFGRRAAPTSVPAASSCPFPASLPPSPGGSAEGIVQPPRGGTGRERRDGADPQQHNKVPTRPRWCWRRWVGDRQGSSLAPGTAGGMGTRLGPPRRCSGEGSVPRPPGMRAGEGHQPGGTELGPSVLFLKGLLLGDERPEGAIPEAGADAEA